MRPARLCAARACADGADISRLRIERGLALQDLLTGAYEFIERIELPPQARVFLLDHLATTEYVFVLDRVAV